MYGRISTWVSRSKEQIAVRLDKLMAKIRKMQSPYMKGEKSVDVVLVSFYVVLQNTPQIPTWDKLLAA